ncbi:MAG: thiamine-phosphate kinase [Allosphingosinicella sp.]
MSRESAFIDSLRALAADPAARGLADDAAVLEVGGATLVLTHDMLAEGVHFLPSDPPGDVAWKLVAVNFSDLAAKGARPLGVLLGFALGGEAWDRGFAEGLGLALRAFGVPLLGGDTVRAPRVLGMTAIGAAAGPVPARSGGQAGDDLWVSGTIGDAGAGLAALRDGAPCDPLLIERYRTPRPRLEAGRALAPLVRAMMDVSDGLLLDARRIAEASRLALSIDLAAVPLSKACRAAGFTPLAAATAGDDYELLFAASPERRGDIHALADRLALPLTRIGGFAAGAGLSLSDGEAPVPLPAKLGWEHG